MLGRAKDTFQGTVFTNAALLCDLVRWEIGWFVCGISRGMPHATLGIGAGSMSTLGSGAPLITLGSSAGSVIGSGGISWPGGATSIALACGVSMARRLSIACSWSLVRLGDRSAGMASVSERRQ